MEYHRVLLFLLWLCLYQRASTQGDVFSVTPGNVIAKLGLPARLDCKLRADDGGIVEWTRNGNQMISFSICNCQTLLNGSLYFNSTAPNSEGNYSCFVNRPFTIVHGSITIAVNPSITPSSSDIIHDQNSTFTIDVNVSGIPQPEVTWSSNSLAGITMINNSSLLIANAQYSNAGRYSVQAINCANTDEQHYNVFIRFLPIITMARSTFNDTVAVGSNVTVTCSVVSYPASIVRWERQTSGELKQVNASDQLNDDTTSVFRVNTTSRIAFTSSEINGASEYCCVATNEIGTAVQCLGFTEDGAPSIPSGFNYTRRTPSSLTVKWNPLVLSGITYEFQYRVVGGSWSTKISLRSDQTMYTLDNLQPDTVYELRVTSVKSSLSSLPAVITVRTLISVPGDVLSFVVDSTLNLGTFHLTWQAPQDSVVDHYIVFIRSMNNETTRRVDGMKTLLDVEGLSENVEYMFAVQAVNDGGPGNITSFKSGVFCLTVSTIEARSVSRGTTVDIYWELSNSVNSSRGIMFVVTEISTKIKFSSKLIQASNRHRCISNLKPNTRYGIRVVAILNCNNATDELDIRTQSATADSSNDCIVFNSTLGGIGEGESTSSLEVWVIVLIVLIPILAVVVMLSIGIYCACKKRYSSKDLELPSVASAGSQAPLGDHMRHHSASSYTGSLMSGTTTPIRSPPSYHSRSAGYRPALNTYNGRIEEQPSVTPI